VTFCKEFLKLLEQLDTNSITDATQILENTFQEVDHQMSKFEYEGCTATGSEFESLLRSSCLYLESW
jgi:hypothetical protein